MKKRKWFGRNLADTAFSELRLIIWSLGIALILLVIGIIVLGYQGKDIVPLGSLAGTIIGAFIGRVSKK